MGGGTHVCPLLGGGTFNIVGGGSFKDGSFKVGWLKGREGDNS